MAITRIKNYKLALGFLCSGMFFTACASTGTSTGTSAGTSRGTPQKSQLSSIKTGLPAQTLDAGDCGLFVWAATMSKPFILFSRADQSRGLWYHEIQEPISLIKGSGASAFGQFPENRFQRPNGQMLDLALSNAEMIEDGIRYKSGTLTFQTVEGWEKVMPVIGLAACQRTG